MESYGLLLRRARESKQISIETAAKDTNILSEFIVALENEDTAHFPGSTYVVGFLRNYADYLELDSEWIANLYKNVLLQEALPPEGLIEKPKPRYFVPLVVAASFVAVALIAFGIVDFKLFRPKRIEKRLAEEAANKRVAQEYEFDGFFSGRVHIGDKIIVHLANDGEILGSDDEDYEEGKKIALIVTDDRNSRLSLHIPGDSGEQHFDLAAPRDIDIDDDKKPDINIRVTEVSADDSSRGAQITMKLSNGAFETTGGTQRALASETLYTANGPRPFTVSLLFSSQTLYRYQRDKDRSVQRLYDQNTGRFSIPNINNSVRVWLANGSSAKLEVNDSGTPYQLSTGNAGEAFVKDIKWIRTRDNRYSLVVQDVD